MNYVCSTNGGKNVIISGKTLIFDSREAKNAITLFKTHPPFFKNVTHLRVQPLQEVVLQR